MNATHQPDDCYRREGTTNVKPRLHWSLNVGGSDDVTYQLPTSCSAALSLMRDQCCQVPSYYYQENRRQQRGFVEVAIFLASDSNNRIELTVHDPTANRSTCYQLEINEDVAKMELIPLPPCPQDEPSENGTTSSQRAFGVALILATSEGISIFSLVFTAAGAAQDFAMSECLELSDFEHAKPNYSLGKDRNIRDMKSKILFADQESSKDKLRTLVVVASSLPSNRHGTQTQSSSYNVDALFYNLRDHQCPIFQYGTNSGSQRKFCNSLGLLRDVGKVVDVAFLGHAKEEEGKGMIIISVLLAGELKLIPIQAAGNTKARPKIQTVLLTGICAHPSLSGLGEAVLVESNHANNGASTLAIFCLPKSNEIGYKAFTLGNDGMMSIRKTVSFSPSEAAKDASRTSNTASSHFFPTHTQSTCSRHTEAIQTPLPESRDSLKAANNVSLLSMSSASPLVGLQLLNSTTKQEHPQVYPTSNANGSAVLDLTGKFGRSENRDHSLLSPLSGLLLDESHDDIDESSILQIQTNVSPKRQTEHSMLTPVNFPRSDLGARSALKSIQRTCKFTQEYSLAPQRFEEQLPHVILVTVEPGQSGSPCRVNVASIAIPAPEDATLEVASMTWGDPLKSTHEKLFVATNNRSEVGLVEISYSQNGDELSPRVDSVKSCCMEPFVKSLDVGRQGREPHKLKAISIGLEKSPAGSLELRMLLTATHSAIPSTPINIKSVEDAFVCMASTALVPPDESKDVKSSDTRLAQEHGTDALLAKLNEMMRFMQRIEEKVDTGMADIEKRIQAVEEAMRTC